MSTLKESPLRALGTKAELTRASIVDAALEMAKAGGLESLTIGGVAERTGLSKSGVFSRVGSREELQLAALQEYEQRFVADVLAPALREPRGLPRLYAMFRRWAQQIIGDEAGCIFISAAVEYDDRSGPVRDAVLAGIAEWRRQLARTLRQAVDEGQLRPDADVEQMAFEMHALMMGLHHDVRLFRDPRAADRTLKAIDRLLQQSRV
jgi:AcrR family transcriptional regulator